MPELLEQLVTLVMSGGPVMVPLLACLLALWCTLGFRWITLQRGDARPLEDMVDAARAGKLTPSGVIDAAAILAVQVRPEPRAIEVRLADLRRELEVGGVVVASIVVAAPLLGLLGTVAGMIETFESLAEMAMFARTGGISGGISQALITTQFGLAIAIPGVLIGRLLQRRQNRLEEELSTLGSLVARGAR